MHLGVGEVSEAGKVPVAFLFFSFLFVESELFVSEVAPGWSDELHLMSLSIVLILEDNHCIISFRTRLMHDHDFHRSYPCCPEA